MSTIIAVKQALLEQCIAMPGGVFNADNAKIDDWRILDTSKSAKGLLIEIGEDTREGDNLESMGQHGYYLELHTIHVYVSQKVGTGSRGSTSIIEDLIQTTEDLKDWLRTESIADSSVLGIRLPRTSPILDRTPRNDGAPTHVMQRITVQVLCESKHAGASTAW